MSQSSNSKSEELIQLQANSHDQYSEGRWSEQEHLGFLQGKYFFMQAVIQHGKDWSKVAAFVRTRDSSQVRSHAQKYFLKLKRANKERKKNKFKTPKQAERAELQLISRLSCFDITSKTPPQIIQLILEFNSGPKKGSHQSLPEQQDCNDRKDCSWKWPPPNQSALIIRQIQKFVPTASESYLMYFIRKNKQHFEKGYTFSQLIDFGPQAEQQIQSIRKQSIHICSAVTDVLNDSTPHPNS